MFRKKKPSLTKVYSFPRSGTHLLEAFLGINFYQNLDLSIKPIEWGHWANRKIKKEGNEYGELFGHHLEPQNHEKNNPFPKVYIVRDPRAVAYSIWKTPNFLNPELTGISFSDFLRIKMDWYGSPSVKCEPSDTIFEQWHTHYNAWFQFKHSSVKILRYENLCKNPQAVYDELLEWSSITRTMMEIQAKVNAVKEKTGLLPNAGMTDAWKNEFKPADYDYYNQLKKDHQLFPS